LLGGKRCRGVINTPDPDYVLWDEKMATWKRVSTAQSAAADVIVLNTLDLNRAKPPRVDDSARRDCLGIGGKNAGGPICVRVILMASGFRHFQRGVACGSIVTGK
jgi:hypothetical protein